MHLTFLDDLLHSFGGTRNGQISASRSKRVAKGSQTLSDGFTLNYF
jgi:hypothetical protein